MRSHADGVGAPTTAGRAGERARWRGTVATALAVPLLAGCPGVGPEPGRQQAESPAVSTPARSPGAAPGSASLPLPEVVERVEPSVVTVFAGSGVGSGVVYRDDGTVVTNAHVVGRARQVELALADGSRVDGQVLATDPVTDLAVIRADSDDLPAATFQESLPRVGETVLAIGSPLGFTNTVTAGIVSGLGREIPGSARTSRALVDLIQTDAPISPGNSGGALVDTSGEIVGINEAYIPPQAGAVSLGFAIPAATVVDVVDELLATGRASHPFLGIVPDRLTDRLAEAFDLDVDGGVLVREVTEDGPAARAGIEAGDVVTTFDGERVRTVEEFLGALRESEPGDRVDVEIVRQDETRTVQVTLGRLDS